MILIVEDEPDIAELIRFHLEREGHRAESVASGRRAVEIARRHQPDLLVLDLMLPDLGGLEVCRQLKFDAATRTIPILIVSARGEESDIVTGLELGADDYVTKPFSPRVLMARVRAVLRRAQEAAPVETTTNGHPRCHRLAGEALVIDLDRHIVTVHGEPVSLTQTEFGVLEYLATRPGFVRTRDQIIAAVHGDDAVLTRRTVDVHVTAIRRKLGDVGRLVETVRGVGYRLAESLEGAAATS